MIGRADAGLVGKVTPRRSKVKLKNVHPGTEKRSGFEAFQRLPPGTVDGIEIAQRKAVRVSALQLFVTPCVDAIEVRCHPGRIHSEDYTDAPGKS